MSTHHLLITLLLMTTTAYAYKDYGIDDYPDILNDRIQCGSDMFTLSSNNIGICDPDRILSDPARHIVVQKVNKIFKKHKSPCAGDKKTGIKVFVVLM